MMYQAWRLWKTKPRGLVRSSAGLIAPGMWNNSMSPLAFQSWIAKNLISICLDLSVGLQELTMVIEDSLSS